MVELQEADNSVSHRIRAMREKLRAVLEREGEDWSHVTDQIGMFCYTGISKMQVRGLPPG